MPRRRARLFLLAVLITSSCSRPSPCGEKGYRPDRDEFSVMTFNVMRWCYDDRDTDGQRDDPKPESEKKAVVALIAGVRPDVLAIEEMGDPTLLREFAGRLSAAGLDYPHAEHLPSADGFANLAVLSRFPIVSRQHVTNETYSIGDLELPVQRGFLSVDIQPSASYRFRLMTAHLKSKVFSAHGQTEMRRNEARLLNKHVRRALAKDPQMNLLVAGDLNDSIDSAALREVMGQDLFDLRPRDAFGDLWSHFWAEPEQYSRIDYLLASAGMLREVVSNKTHVVRDPLTYKASDHRPVVAVFKARDI
jgi:endonuclease/exonuclease/phosphatase family metal-dependent hydrolase